MAHVKFEYEKYIGSNCLRVYIDNVRFHIGYPEDLDVPELLNKLGHTTEVCVKTDQVPQFRSAKFQDWTRQGNYSALEGFDLNKAVSITRYIGDPLYAVDVTQLIGDKSVNRVLELQYLILIP